MFDLKKTNIIKGAVVPQPASNSRLIIACNAKIPPKIDVEDEVEYELDSFFYLEDKEPEPYNELELEIKPKITLMKRLKNLFVRIFMVRLKWRG